MRRVWRRLGAMLMVAVLVAAGCSPAPSPHPPTRFQPSDDTAAFSELQLTRGDGVPIGVADPDILKVGDSWYLYATTSTEDGFEAWSSDDLFSWTYEGFVWTPTPGSWNDHGAYWAPDLYQSANGIYLYYTAGNKIGVARADTPLGPFVEVLDHPLIGNGYGGVGDGQFWGTPTDPIPLLDSDEHAIDAFLFEASDGSLTLYFSAYPALGIAVMSAIPMIDETTPAAEPATVVLEPNVFGWERFIREAAWVTEHDGVYHLTYSGSGADTSCYAIGEATATNPLGPFTRTGPAPLLHDDPTVGFYGPGHHTITEGPGGDLVMFFHTKDDYEQGYDRHVRWAPVSVDGAGNLQIDGAVPGTSTTGTSSCAFG